MTAQLAEELVCEGPVLPMFTQPLDDYFALADVEPRFAHNDTGLWRGYRGRWEITEGRLYLVRLTGTLDSGARASLGTLFPSFASRVFAHWYSGVLTIPQGRLLRYVHSDHHSRYEGERLICIERGCVQSPHSSPPVATDGSFEIAKQHLQERLSQQAIESRERVHDPLGAVPDLPFGHIHAAWQAFLQRRAPGDELWSFSARWFKGCDRCELQSGYVRVRDGVPGACFLTVRMDETNHGR